MLEFAQLVAQRLRQPIAELRVVLLYRGNLLPPFAGVNGEQLAHTLVRKVESLGLDAPLAHGRHQPNRGIDGVRLSLAATEDPCQDPRVLSIPRPQKLAFRVLAEPVD